MAIVAVVLHFNDLIFLRDRARRNHSNIDVALKKRADLIPRLKAAASGLMAHEQEVQTHLASLRSKSESQADRGSHDAIVSMIGLSEAYPEINSSM